MNKFFLFALLVVIAGSCGNNFGSKVSKGHIETYYKDGITKEQAEKTVNFLYDIETENSNDTGTIKKTQLVKKGDTITFRMEIPAERYKALFELAAEDTTAGGKLLAEKKVQDASYLFQVIGNILSDSIFEGKPVNVDLTNKQLKTIRSITYVKTDYAGGAADSPVKYTAGKVEVLAADIDAETSQKLADFLVTKLGTEVAAKFYLSRPANDYATVKLLSKKENAANTTTAQLEEMASDISKAVFFDAGLHFEIVDEQMNLLKKHTYLPDGLRNQPEIDTTPKR